MSQARVGELVGRASSTIRAWERGQSMPNEPALLSTLAAVLGLDEARLFELADLEPPEITEEYPTIEQSLLEIAPPGSRPTARGESFVQEAFPVEEVEASAEAAVPGTNPVDVVVEGTAPLDRADEPRPQPDPDQVESNVVVVAPELVVSPGPGLDGDVDGADSEADVIEAQVAADDGPGSGETRFAETETTAGEASDPGVSDPGVSDLGVSPAGEIEAAAAEALGVASMDPVPEVPDRGASLARRRDLRATNGAQTPVTPPLDRALQLLRGWASRFAEALPRRASRPKGPTGPPLSPSYMEIPEQRRVYQLRRIYTAIAVVVTLSLVLWAFAQAKEAFFSTLDLLLDGL